MNDIEAIRKEFCLVGPITELDPCNVKMDAAGYYDLVRVAIEACEYPGLNALKVLESISDANKAQAYTDQAEGNLIWVVKIEGVTHYIQVPRGGWKYEA